VKPVRLGLDSFSYNLTIEDPDAPRDTFWFLERCARLGLDGCQLDPRHVRKRDAERRLWDEGFLRKVGDFCRRHGLYLELGDWRFGEEALTQHLELAAEVGARSLRTFYGGRRHKMSAAEIAAGVEESIRGLAALAPVAERVRVPLALENHEEFTSAEIIRIIEAVGSPYVRACLDSGNGMMVGEDPLECTRALAPYAAAVHLKDWVVREEGGEPRWEDRVLGRGDARAAEAYAVLREANPDLPITIENPTWGSLRAVTRADEERNVVESVAFARSLAGRHPR